MVEINNPSDILQLYEGVAYRRVRNREKKYVEMSREDIDKYYKSILLTENELEKILDQNNELMNELRRGSKDAARLTIMVGVISCIIGFIASAFF